MQRLKGKGAASTELVGQCGQAARVGGAAQPGTQASGAGPAEAGLIPAEQHSQWRVSYASPVAVQKVMCGVQATI